MIRESTIVKRANAHSHPRDPRLFVLPSTGDTQVPFAHQNDGRGSSASRSQRALAASI